MNVEAFYKLTYGVYVVSTLDGDRPTGCIANSAMQITSEPATIAVSVNHDNYTNQCIDKSGVFALNIMSEKSDPTIIGTFGFQSGKDIDKFDNVDYEIRDRLPILMASNAYIACEVINKFETSTHTVFLGKVIEGDVLSKETSMTYAYYHNVVKGKSPKNAPTYIKEEDIKKMSEITNKKYVCTICEYEYDGDVSFDELPDDYTCPICGYTKSAFEER